jgi:hypothetical protein
MIVFFWHSAVYNLDTKINHKHYVVNTRICIGTAIPSQCSRLIFGIFNTVFHILRQIVSEGFYEW